MGFDAIPPVQVLYLPHQETTATSLVKYLTHEPPQMITAMMLSRKAFLRVTSLLPGSRNVTFLATKQRSTDQLHHQVHLHGQRLHQACCEPYRRHVS